MDEKLLLMINQGWASSWLDPFFIWVSDKATFSAPLLLIILGISLRAFKKDGVKFWLLLLAVILFGDLMGNIIKHIAGQARPCFDAAGLVRLPWDHDGNACRGNLNGMPSNHALNFFATAVFVMAVTGIRLWGIVLLGIAVLVSLSRIYLAKHYPSQVLAGAALGAATGYLAAWAGIKYFGFINRIHAQRPFNNKGNHKAHDC